MTLLTPKIVSIAMLCAAITVATACQQQLRAQDAGRPADDWLQQDYPYLAINQALPDVLRELGHNLDFAVDVGPGVRGRIRHYQHEGSAGDFLQYLESEHRLEWVLDKERLYISAADEKMVRSWPGTAEGFEAVRAALTGVGLDDQRFPIGFDAGSGVINLFAPPRYVALASPVIERVLAPKSSRTVNVIHGRSRTGGT